MYRDGKYMPPDREKALNWFEKGAEWKDPYSMAALADMLMAVSYTHLDVYKRQV